MKNSVIKVLQLDRNIKESRSLSYAGLDLIKDCGLEVKKEYYKSVYETTMEVDDENINASLEQMFCQFQGCQDPAYTGHSLSVSDMIEVDGVCYSLTSLMITVSLRWISKKGGQSHGSS